MAFFKSETQTDRGDKGILRSMDSIKSFEGKPTKIVPDKNDSAFEVEMYVIY